MEATGIGKPEQIWQDFYDAWGPEVMKAAYYWDKPPVDLRPGEIFIVFREGDSTVGWGSLIPFDSGYLVSVGVFPKYRGRGLYRDMVNTMTGYAFRATPAKFVMRQIYDTNKDHQARVIAEGFPWLYSGRLIHPEPASLFFACTKADWLDREN